MELYTFNVVVIKGHSFFFMKSLSSHWSWLEGCQRLADYMEGVKENVESTTQVLKHNCEMNKHGEVFYKLGVYYVQGRGSCR
uniref:Cytochrome c oxidase assembly factor 7 n=1 Tax=Oncorhynchus tshawytscha TaxID=74940 RepID=A0AAZ3RKP7_ONCTS